MVKPVGFPTPVAATLGGVSQKTIINWRARGFLKTSILDGRAPSPSIYSFRDIIAIRVAAGLCAQGFELRKLKKIVAYLRRRKGLDLSASDVLASTLLISNGSDVYEVASPGDLIGVSTLRVPGQMMMLIAFGQLVAEVKEAALRHGEAA